MSNEEDLITAADELYDSVHTRVFRDEFRTIYLGFHRTPAVTADDFMFQDEARAEAEQQYPALNPDAEELTYPRAALRQGKRSAFIKGALWAMSRPAPPVITDEMVERAAPAPDVQALIEYARMYSSPESPLLSDDLILRLADALESAHADNPYTKENNK